MTHRVCFRKTVLWFAVLLFACIFAAGNVNYAMAEQLAFAAPGPYQITGIQTSRSGEGVMLRVTGSAPPTFTMYELFEPQRIILDIADGSFAQSMQFPLTPGEGPVTEIKGRVLDDKEPRIARLEMLTADDASYTVERDVNDILIYFKQKGAAAAATPAIAASAKKAPVAEAMQAETVEPMEGQMETAQPEDVEVAEAAEEPVAAMEETPAAAPAASETVSIPARPPAGAMPMLDELSAAGYTKPPITIDFYKIDMHNVFRLFGEISGMNIVIAEGVGGTLTLALDNVPWDFVLDIVLNLKNLQAIERYNTLVIAPKGRSFEWPEREQEKVKVVESITIKEEFLEEVKQKEARVTPPNELEAQKLMHEASLQAKKEDYESALELYERAYAKWPNARLANRLASMYLVHMGMNAKSVYYGKEALRMDENDRNSALYTAVGLANMKRNSEAKEYFDIAVSGERPASEALVSYAMFSEENANYVDALMLLARNNDIYGDTIDTMIARARIYDKEGNSNRAVAEYRAILLSGYKLPSDLERYIRGRLALENNKMQGGN